MTVKTVNQPNPSFDLKNLDRACEFVADLKGIAQIRNLLRYNTETFSINRVVFFVHTSDSPDSLIADLSSDNVGSPVDAADLMEAYCALLDNKERLILKELEKLGAKPQAHQPAPLAPSLAVSRDEKESVVALEDIPERSRPSADIDHAA